MINTNFLMLILKNKNQHDLRANDGNLLWHNFIVFLVLFLSSLFVYRRALDIQIPAESFPLMFVFKKLGISGVLDNFYDIGITTVSDLIIFLLYTLLGTHAGAWVISSLVIHSINAFLIYIISLSLYASFSFNNRIFLSFFSALLFLLSPFQTEVVLLTPRWLNFSIATVFVLLSCFYLIHYAQRERHSHLILFHFFFILSIFSYESSLSFPVVAVVYLVLHRFVQNRDIKIKTILVKIIIPYISILFFYFLTCKLWKGEWILHYGAATHLNFLPTLIAENSIKYLAKFFLFYRYLPDTRYELLHNFLHIDITDNTDRWILFSVMMILLCFLFFYLFKSSKSNTFLLLFLLLAFFISLIPVINLDSSFTGAVISDRYGYFPSVFFYMFLPLLCYVLFKKIWKIVIIGLLVISWYCLSQTIPLWSTASDYSKCLIKNFEPYLSAENIFVLNMPDNCNWIMTYRSGFPEMLDFTYGGIPKHIQIVAGFYMASPQDSIKVSYTNKNLPQIYIESIPAKRSFLLGGGWAKSYETERYSVIFNDDLSAYTLTFKNKFPSDTIILYILGDKWREFKL